MTTSKTLLLLSGWAGSGKDAAAALLVEEMNFTRVAFADGLKEDVSKETGIPLSHFHDKCYKDTPVEGVTPRDHLLRHALAVRKSDPDVYSRRVAENITTYEEARFVVSDWRYKREYEHLRKILHSNVTVVRGRIQRPGILPSNDPSEHDLDGESFDFTIQNDGCISDLRDDLKAIMRRVL